jgi:hypothetical protein
MDQTFRGESVSQAPVVYRGDAFPVRLLFACTIRRSFFSLIAWLEVKP